MKQVVAQELIENRIFVIRGQRVMLDSDLSQLYGVKTFNLNKAVKRNINRFPIDFMFQLTKKEYDNLRFQFGIPSYDEEDSGILRSQIVTSRWGGRRYLPYAFTEQGVAMLSSVLNSERAVQVNIIIMRAFVKIREILSTHKELAAKLRELEHKVSKHDNDILMIFEAIRQLMAPLPEPPKKRIGFHP